MRRRFSRASSRAAAGLCARASARAMRTTPSAEHPGLSPDFGPAAQKLAESGLYRQGASTCASSRSPGMAQLTSWKSFNASPVSYTHLTLPTICSV
eukprot:12280725-Alexandrium_andersonii.AAC.1